MLLRVLRATAKCKKIVIEEKLLAPARLESRVLIRMVHVNMQYLSNFYTRKLFTAIERIYI